MERTESHIKARIAAESKGLTLIKLVNSAISKGEFPRPGIGGDYSFSWIYGRLLLNDSDVSKKLVGYANTL
jgi:hypothetical protein